MRATNRKQQRTPNVTDNYVRIGITKIRRYHFQKQKLKRAKSSHSPRPLPYKKTTDLKATAKPDHDSNRDKSKWSSALCFMWNMEKYITSSCYLKQTRREYTIPVVTS